MHKTKKHDGMDASLKPLMVSEFAAAINKSTVPSILESGFASAEQLQKHFGVSLSHLRAILRNSNRIERKQFKLSGMKSAQYFYRVKK